MTAVQRNADVIPSPRSVRLRNQVIRCSTENGHASPRRGEVGEGGGEGGGEGEGKGKGERKGGKGGGEALVIDVSIGPH